MELIGYGLLKDGKPAGLWPMGHFSTTHAFHRYKEKYPDAQLMIVPVYIGSQVSPAVVGAPEPKETA